MEDLFPSYYKPKTKAELEKLFREAQIVFDTNVLISLFGFHTATAKDWLKVLTELKDRLWLPHQVAKEYQSQIEGIIHVSIALKFDNFSEKCKKFKLPKHLSGSENFKGSIMNGGSMNRIDSIFEECEKQLAVKMEEVQKIVEDEKERLTTHADNLKFELAKLFNGRVGNGFTDDELIRASQIAETRYKLKIPPGHADEGASYGDAFLWLQTLEYAKSIAPKPLILVTNDHAKGDWFVVGSDGQVKGPLPELVAEMKKIAGIDFHLYRPGLFLTEAKRLLKELEIKQDSVKETKRYNSYVVPMSLTGMVSPDVMKSLVGSSFAESHKSLMTPPLINTDVMRVGTFYSDWFKANESFKNMISSSPYKDMLEASKRQSEWYRLMTGQKPEDKADEDEDDDGTGAKVKR